VTNRRRFAKPGMSMPNPFGGQDQVHGCSVLRDLVKPAGPVDPQIVFLSVQAADGRPLAVLANYSMHDVGEVPSQDVSADYFGAFADRIQQLREADRLDPPFVGILSNGTSGAVDNTYARPPERPAPYERLRHVAGDVAQGVFAQCQKLQYHDGVPLGMVQREVELAVRKPTAEPLVRAKEILADPQRPDKLPHERTYAQRIMRQQEAPAAIRVIVQDLRIGDLGIATSPFETFAETELEIKAKSPLQADVHDRTGQRLLRLPAHARTAPAWRLRDLAGHEQSRDRGLDQAHRCAVGDARRVEGGEGETASC